MNNPANPKKAFGDRKLSLHRVPPAFIAYTALGLRDGGYKYGPWNWREVGIEAETYVGSVMRHLQCWLDGEELTRDSRVPHLAAAAAGLSILVDSLTRGTLIDNRPPPGKMADILDQYTLDDSGVEYLNQLNEARLAKRGETQEDAIKEWAVANIPNQYRHLPQGAFHDTLEGPCACGEWHGEIPYDPPAGGGQ